VTFRRLSRSAGDGRAAAPVRLVHLGLGSFFKAHQAWYTEHSPEAHGWGYAAFCGRGAEPAASLMEQDGLYTLAARGPVDDEYEVVSSISEAHPAGDHESWLACFSSPDLAAVTVTVTEAGYRRGSSGGLNLLDPLVASDVESLRRGIASPVRSAPARLVAGLRVRRAAGLGPLAVIPCDNIAGNGPVMMRVLTGVAEAVDPALAGWIAQSVEVVSTVVDRITPRTTAADTDLVARRTSRADAAVVVAEPYTEWVLAGRFPRGRPEWERAGAVFTTDLAPYEHRKLWLLNGAHSLLAYAGTILGYHSVSAAIADETCRGWVETWWGEATAQLEQAPDEIAGYMSTLLERFTNPRIQDPLSRIAEDGSQKIPVRVLPVLLAERAGSRPAPGATLILAAWVCHLRGMGAPVRDVLAGELVAKASGPLEPAVRAVLSMLDPLVGADEEVVCCVAEQCRALASRRAT
jgi:fructuronate reductase